MKLMKAAFEETRGDIQVALTRWVFGEAVLTGSGSDVLSVQRNTCTIEAESGVKWEKVESALVVRGRIEQGNGPVGGHGGLAEGDVVWLRNIGSKEGGRDHMVSTGQSLAGWGLGRDGRYVPPLSS